MPYYGLREVQRMTGISRPSLIKYAKRKSIKPHTATTYGGRTLYSEGAITKFQFMREAGVRKRGKA